MSGANSRMLDSVVGRALCVMKTLRSVVIHSVLDCACVIRSSLFIVILANCFNLVHFYGHQPSETALFC